MGMLLQRHRTTALTTADMVTGRTVPSPTVELLDTVPVKEYVEPKVEEVIPESAQEEFPYTKTEINRMSTSELKKVAKKFGIDKDLNGTEIKKQLIAKYGL